MESDVGHSVSVAGVIVDDQGRVLVIQRQDNGRWEPPGGVLEPSEDIISGLRREIVEETGLEVVPQALTGVYKNMNRAIMALVFQCRPSSGVLTAGPETSDLRWVAPADIPHLVTEAYAIRFLDAVRPQTPPPVRHHDGVHLLSETHHPADRPNRA